MAWVQTVPEDAATSTLGDLYRKVRERAGVVPNIAKVQSLYCQLMDDPSGLTKRDRVLIATVVSKVNGCFY
jgi:hypothetical protein